MALASLRASPRPAVGSAGFSLRGSSSASSGATLATPDRCRQSGLPSGRAASAAARSVASRALPQEYAEKLQGTKVLVAGATGGTGRQVVEVLQELGVPVRALVRDEVKARSVISQREGTEIVKGDVFQYSSLIKAFGDAKAVIVATGAGTITDPLGPFNVDYQGTLNLLALAKQRGVKKFVLVSSIGVDDLINLLNLFWGVCFWKKRAEEEIQRSGITFTIVRPGGLKSKLDDGEKASPVVMKGPGFYGAPPARAQAEPAGSILRRQVAEVCVASLVESSSDNKVVEVVTKKDAIEKTYAELFEGVEM